MMSRFFCMCQGATRGSAAAVVAMVAAGCVGVQGNGIAGSEARNVSGFRAIEASGALKIEVTQASAYRVEVSTDENLLPWLRTEVHEGTLTIDTDDDVQPTSPIRVWITAPAIQAVSLSGSADAMIKHIEGRDFRLDTSGSSDAGLSGMKLSGTLIIDTAGSSEIRAQGQSHGLVIDTSGSSSIDTRALPANAVSIETNGSADVVVFAKESLSVELNGASSVRYSGNPKVTSFVSGTGAIQRL